MSSQLEDLSGFNEKLLAQNYYERLNLSPKATGSEIKKAFFKLSLKYHPDRNPSPYAENIFKLIHDAYVTLIDPQMRREYDNLLQNGLGHLPSQANYKKAGSFEYHHENLENIHKIAISNNYIAIPISGKGIHLLNNRTGDYLQLLTNESHYPIHYNVMIDEQENRLYAASGDGHLEVYSLETGELLKTHQKVYGFAEGSSSVVNISNNEKLAYDRRKITELSNDGRRREIARISGINHVSVSPNKQVAIVSSGKTESVHLVNIKNGKEIQRFNLGFPAYHAQMSPDSKYVACGGYSNIVKLFDVKTGRFKEIVTSGGQVNSLNFSPNGKFLLIGEYKFGYSIYSLDEGKIVYSERVNGYIKDVFFTNNNRLIINAYNHVYNMPIPLTLAITSNKLGAEIASIEYPCDERNQTSGQGISFLRQFLLPPSSGHEQNASSFNPSRRSTPEIVASSSFLAPNEATSTNTTISSPLEIQKNGNNGEKGKESARQIEKEEVKMERPQHQREEKEDTPLIKSLQSYIKMRLLEARVSNSYDTLTLNEINTLKNHRNRSFLGKKLGFTAYQKIEAAEHLIDAIKDNNAVSSITKKDIDASNNSRLWKEYIKPYEEEFQAILNLRNQPSSFK